MSCGSIRIVRLLLEAAEIRRFYKGWREKPVQRNKLSPQSLNSNLLSPEMRPFAVNKVTYLEKNKLQNLK
jgi:hypothetical protein